MIDVLSTALTVVALLGATWSLVLIALNRPLLPPTTLSLGLTGVLALLEIGLLAQAITGVAQLVATGRELDRVTFVGYLVGPVVILPLATLWSAAERTRWGTGVLVVGCLSVPVMIVRLHQIWAGHG